MIFQDLYLEFLYPITDYFRTLKRNEAYFELAMPLICAILVNLFILTNINLEKLGSFIGYIINFLAILVGFSITAVTILSSESGQRFEILRKMETDRKIGNKPIHGYQLILITFIYVILVEFFTLAYNLIYYLSWMNGIFISYYKIIISINIFLMFHVIALNIRNITNFYFIFWKLDNKQSPPTIG
jgi:hypothetical protein